MTDNPSTPRPLPLQQAKLLRYVGEFHALHGMPPSLADMAAHLKVKNPSNYLEPLIKKGYVRRLLVSPKGRARGVALTDAGIEWVDASSSQTVLNLRSRFVQYLPRRRPQEQMRLRMSPARAATTPQLSAPDRATQLPLKLHKGGPA